MADDDGFSDLLMAIKEFDDAEGNKEKFNTNQNCVDTNISPSSTPSKNQINSDKSTAPVESSPSKEQLSDRQSASNTLGDAVKLGVESQTPDDVDELSPNSDVRSLKSTNNPETLTHQHQIKTEPPSDDYEASVSAPQQPEINPSLCIISCVSSLSSTEQTSLDLSPSSSYSTSEQMKSASVPPDVTPSSDLTPLDVSVKLEPLDSNSFTSEPEANPIPETSETPLPDPSLSNTWEQNLTAVIDAVASGRDSSAEKSCSSSTSQKRDSGVTKLLKGPKSKRGTKQAALKSDSFTSLVPLLTRLTANDLALYTDLSLSPRNSGKNTSVMKVDGIAIEIDCPGPSLPVEDLPTTSKDSKDLAKRGKTVAKKRASAKSTNSASKKSAQLNASVSDKAKESGKSIKKEIDTSGSSVKLEPPESAKEATKGLNQKRGGKSARLEVCKKEVNSPKTRSTVNKAKLGEDKNETPNLSESKSSKERSTHEPVGVDKDSSNVAGTKSRRDSDNAKKAKDKLSDKSNDNMETNLEGDVDHSAEQTANFKEKHCVDSVDDKVQGRKGGQKTLMEMNVESYLTEANQLLGKKANKLNFTVPRIKETAKKENSRQERDKDSEKLSNSRSKKKLAIKSEPSDESVSRRGRRSESRSSSCDTAGSVLDDAGDREKIPSYLELDKSTKLWKIKEKLRHVGALIELCIQGFDKTDIGQIVQVVSLFTSDFEVYARWTPSENMTIFISCVALEVVKNLLLQIYTLCLSKRSLTIGFKHVGMYPATQITFRVNMPNGISVFDDTTENCDLSTHEATFSGSLQRVPAVCYPYVLLGSQHCQLQKVKADSDQA
ncbi:hypothetical protein EGW08_016669, partial [Elysia chlorotica]